MNNFKVFAFTIFFAVLALPVLAEPNSTAPAQQALKAPCQAIAPAPEPVIPPQLQLQPETTSTEQIIDKAHQYYDSALDHALTVIGVSVAILAVGFVLIQIFIELQRNRSFKEQLDKKEEQLQKYFDKRIEKETKTLKEDAQKQLDGVIHDIRTNFRRIYASLALTQQQLYEDNKDSKTLCFWIYLKLSGGLMNIDLKDYENTVTGLNGVKRWLPKITEKSRFWLIDTAIERLSEKVSETKDEKLQKAFKEFNEALIIRKHELGYTTPPENEQDKQ